MQDGRVGLEMPGHLRALCILLGVAMCGASICLVLQPPNRVVTETSTILGATLTTTSQFDAVNYSVALLASGIILLVFGINGLQLARLTAGGFSAEAASVGDKARNYFAQERDESDVMVVPGGGEESPEPIAPASDRLRTSKDEIDVFQLRDIPVVVLVEALSNWPKAETCPATLADFDFASRRRGRGNHAWFLKFRGHPIVSVSYGGQSKQTATVKNS